MKKLLILLVILAALLATPYFVGSQAEGKMRDVYAELNKMPTYEVTVSEYNRGWFSSSAKVRFAIKIPQTAQTIPDFGLTVTQQMQHGPFLWHSQGFGVGLVDIDFGIELDDAMQAELDKVDALSKDNIRATSRVAFGGSMSSQFEITPFVIDKESVNIAIHQAQVTSSLDSDNHILGQGEWDGMSVSDKGVKVFELGKTRFSMDQKLASGELLSPDAIFVGDFSMNMDRINVLAETPQQNFQMNEISLIATSDINDDLANINIVMGAKEMSVIQQQFSDLVYDVSIEKLDVATLQEFNRLMAENQGADPMVMAAQFQSVLPKLIEKGPMLKINQIGVNTSEGKITSDMQLTFDNQVYDANNPMTMMLALDAKAKGNAPEAFFTNLGMGANIEQMVQQNFLVRDNDLLKFDFTFKGGQALLNGNPIPLGAM